MGVLRCVENYGTVLKTVVIFYIIHWPLFCFLIVKIQILFLSECGHVQNMQSRNATTDTASRQPWWHYCLWNVLSMVRCFPSYTLNPV